MFKKLSPVGFIAVVIIIASVPEYTTDEFFEKIINNKVKFLKDSKGTIFLLNSESNDKIIGAIE